MALTAGADEHRPMFGRITDWLKRWRDRRAVLTALDRFGKAEVERMARDVGVGAGDLRVLAGKWPDGANLLSRRVAALGLDRADIGRIEPQVLRDLQRVCSICDNKRACEHDLDRDPASAAWRDYCANADTFAAVAGESPKEPAGR